MNFLKVALILLAIATSLFAGDYTINTSNSNASFTAKQLNSTDITGMFNNVSGTFFYDEATNQLQSLSGEIATTSINTADEKRDEKLKGEDILDVKKYPKITFKSTKVDNNAVYGDLTIKGVTKNVKLNIDNKALLDQQVILSLKGEIKRSYFDISWDELLDTGSVTVSNEIKLAINIQGNLVEVPKPVEKKEVKKKPAKKVVKKKIDK